MQHLKRTGLLTLMAGVLLLSLTSSTVQADELKEPLKATGDNSEEQPLPTRPVKLSVVGAAGRQFTGELMWPVEHDPLVYEHTAHALIFQTLGKAGFIESTEPLINLTFIYEEHDPVQCKRRPLDEADRKAGCLKSYRVQFSPETENESGNDRYLSTTLVKKWEWALPRGLFARYRWYNSRIPLEDVRAVHIILPGYTEGIFTQVIQGLIGGAKAAGNAALSGTVAGLVVNRD